MIRDYHAALDGVSDQRFRGRIVHEFKIVAHAARPHIEIGKSRILDFGCGQGIASASFAYRYPGARVFGADIVNPDPTVLSKIYSGLGFPSLPANLELLQFEPGALPDRLVDMDLIYAWSVFEHVHRSVLISTLTDLRSRLTKGGVLFIQIDPLYYSPRGSHLYRYSPSEWCHLTMQLQDLHDLVHDHMPTPADTRAREWNQFATLNRVTADEVCEAVNEAGFEILSQERTYSSAVPPVKLTKIFNTDVLTTTEIRLLLRSA